MKKYIHYEFMGDITILEYTPKKLKEIEGKFSEAYVLDEKENKEAIAEMDKTTTHYFVEIGKDKYEEHNKNWADKFKENGGQ